MGSSERREALGGLHSPTGPIIVPHMYIVEVE